MVRLLFELVGFLWRISPDIQSEPTRTILEFFAWLGMAAFLAYGLGTLSNGIWKGQPWSMTIKEAIDGLIYGLLTAGTFGWLWPK